MQYDPAYDAVAIQTEQRLFNDRHARPLAVGLCGTDFHIVSGEANYHTDARGQPIPLEHSPQVLAYQ